MTARLARLVLCGLLTLGLILLAFEGLIVRAAAPVETPGQAVPAELFWGTLGGVVFGVGGFFGTFALCMASAEDEAGWAALSCALLAIYGYAIGVPIGTTLGVSWAGARAGVQGSVLLSALGAVLGEALGLGIFIGIASALKGPDELLISLVVGFVPFMSALGATLGYNLGAKVAPSPSEL
jgi:hypothetical protein